MPAIPGAIEVRPATAADLRRFYGRDVPLTVRALVAVLDGVPVGAGGYFIQDGVAHAFSDMHPELAGRKKDIIRCARRLVAFIRAAGLPTIARPKEGTGGIALRHYGFARWGDPDGNWYALVN
jgi:hypothetical protein